MNRTCIIGDVGSNWRAGPDEPLAKGLARAKRTIGYVKDAGADVAKFQAMRMEIYPAGYRAEGFDQPLDEFVAPYEVPDGWWPILKEECDRVGIEFMCSVFLPEDVALIDPLVKRHKIASFELGHTELLETVAATEKPLLISTGASSRINIQKALRTLNHGRERATNPYPATVLHCISSYPALPKNMNMLALEDLQYETGCDKGFSDHTCGKCLTAAVVAVAFRADVIEKHVTEHHNLGSPDAHFAADPEEFQRYVAAIREAEQMLGYVVRQPQPGEWTNLKFNPATGKRGA
tara:strand:- start:149 stop:1024 length:876 start_codon:yes stop_codon:yes gene_type:complete